MDEAKKVNESPQTDSVNAQSAQSKIQKIKREYSVQDVIFAYVSMLAALIFTLYGKAYSGFLTSVAFICLILSQNLYLYFTGVKFTRKKLACVICSFVFALAYCFVSSPWPVFVNSVFLWVFLIYSYHYNADSITEFAGNDMYFDLLRACVVAPVSSIVQVWSAAFSLRRKNSKFNINFGGIITGLLIAFFPVVVVVLLLQEDYAFAQMSNKLIDGLFDLDFNFGDFICFILSSMYFYGILFGGRRNNFSEKMSSEANEKTRKSMRFLPVSTSLTVEISLLLVYVFYFISQSAYFLNAFLNILPENYSYAEYARSGFFGLCFVTFINLFVLTVEKVFTLRKQEVVSKTVRVVRFIFCLFTDFLIVINISKMLMYVGKFGLSHQRVVTLWIMLLMFLLFTVIGINQIKQNLRANLAVFLCCAAMTAVMTFSNLDTLIVKYNLAGYYDGRLSSFHVGYLYNCDENALLSAVSLLEDSAYEQEVREVFQDRLARLYHKDTGKRTLPSLIAEQKIRNALEQKQNPKQ